MQLFVKKDLWVEVIIDTKLNDTWPVAFDKLKFRIIGLDPFCLRRNFTLKFTVLLSHVFSGDADVML